MTLSRIKMAAVYTCKASCEQHACMVYMCASGCCVLCLLQVFGQGANSALESCKVLGQVLQEAGGDLDQVPQM